MLMAGLAGSSAAKRRRERQLRAWHRHVRTTVAMELATALHQSAQRPKSRVVEGPSEVVHEKHDGPTGTEATSPGDAAGASS